MTGEKNPLNNTTIAMFLRRVGSVREVATEWVLVLLDKRKKKEC